LWAFPVEAGANVNASTHGDMALGRMDAMELRNTQKLDG
jgi:hypothetical protein